MRSSNPTLLSDNTFTGFGRSQNISDRMTGQGVVVKTAILTLCLLLTTVWTWNLYIKAGHNPAAITTWMWIGAIGGLITAVVTVFKKEWAPVTAPVYAALQGLFVGGISATFETAFPGIVMQAVTLTFGTLIAMLAAYSSGLIRVTDNFKLGVFAATGGIAIAYLISIVLGFFHIQVPFISGNGTFSILFSVFVVAIAALNLVIDFDFIEQGARNGAPKYMEWYGSFALMVTLIWLYIEILNLLSKMRSRD